MSFIAKLKLVASKRERNLSPIILRRQKLATKIEEQLELARCQKNGTLYAPKRLKTVTNESGERVVVETTKRVKEWFWTTPNNKINLSVRYGSKTLELAKGKNAAEKGGKSLKYLPVVEGERSNKNLHLHFAIGGLPSHVKFNQFDRLVTNAKLNVEHIDAEHKVDITDSGWIEYITKELGTKDTDNVLWTLA